MSHEHFLRAIIDSPADDLPRLVYADWLEEHGNPERAEFIRVQCELATLSEDNPRRPGLEDREHVLLERNEAGWIGDIATQRDQSSKTEWTFRRGLLDQLRLLIWYIKDDLFTSHPVTRMEVLGETNSDVDEPEMLLGEWNRSVRELDLSAWKWLIQDYVPVFAGDSWPNLTGLDLSGVPGLSVIHELLGRSALKSRLRSLAFGGRTGPNFRWADAENETLYVPAFAEAMADAPLEDLAAIDCGLTTEGLHHLLKAPFASQLTALDISDNHIAPDAWRAFWDVGRGMRLRRLDVSGTPLANISLRPVLDAGCTETLRELEMNRCGSARVNMEVVARSRFWTQATHLRAHGGIIPAATLEPLCESTGSPALRLLDLADNYVRTEGVRLICDAPWAGGLTWLALSRNYLDDESLAVLADSGRFTKLRTLHLAHNNLDLDRSDGEIITDTGARRLAECPSLSNLRILTVGFTGVTDRGVDMLLNTPHWRLSGLGIDGCDLSPDAVRILASSPRLARLDWLNLAANPRLSGDALLPLAESPYLSRLCELDVGQVYVGARTLEALRDRLGPRLSY